MKIYAFPYKDGYYKGEVDYIDLPHGYGEWSCIDGCHYIGYWRHGEIEGNGKYVYADGSWYEGGWHNNEWWGHGIVHERDGVTYEAARWYGDRMAEDVICTYGSTRMHGKIRRGKFFSDKK